MFRTTKIYADELGLICRDGEVILDAITAVYNSGREKQPDEVNTVTFDLLNGLSVEAWNDAAFQAMAGLTLDVRRGIQARELADAASDHMGYLVLSTRRLMVIDGLKGGVTPEVTWSVQLGDIASLRHNPRFPLEMGRILVAFRDGSLVRLWAGLAMPFSARRFVASFAGTVRG